MLVVPSTSFVPLCATIGSVHTKPDPLSMFTSISPVASDNTTIGPATPPEILLEIVIELVASEISFT